MSQMYIMEPPTNGKLVLRTSAGDIDIELWPKEAPLACRNFVQLCMENYYDATIFHRLVPGFIVQGGDPTGTGMGGESIYGKPFKDEFHSRLRFTHRGLVAMANAGKDDNSSQFFITLGPTNDLNKKHTIFGKVTGDTIYNMVKLSETETDAQERPINPHYIKTTHILNNPFDDIKPRNAEEKPNSENKPKDPNRKKKSKAKAHKKLTVLSFGDEAEEEEKTAEQVNKEIKTKSAHDVEEPTSGLAKGEFKPEVKNEDDHKWFSKRIDGDVELADTDDLASWMRHKMEERNAQIEKEDEEKMAEEMKERKRKVLDYKSQSKLLLKELKDMKKKGIGETEKENKETEKEKEATKEEKKAASNNMYAEYKAKQDQYRKKTEKNSFKLVKKEKASRKNRESETMAMLTGFKGALFNARNPKKAKETEEEDKEKEKAEPGDDIIGNSWLGHSLQREDDMRDKKLNIQDLEAKDMNRDVDALRYDISDPRNPMNIRKRGAESKSGGGKRRK